PAAGLVAWSRESLSPTTGYTTKEIRFSLPAKQYLSRYHVPPAGDTSKYLPRRAHKGNAHCPAAARGPPWEEQFDTPVHAGAKALGYYGAPVGLRRLWGWHPVLRREWAMPGWHLPGHPLVQLILG
ncbi:MAG: hypothetical protein ACREYC_24830, partial [Gammaproteobacteria bacterium]